MLISHPIILACSGPGAGQLIADNIRFSHWCAGFAFVVLAALGYLYWKRGGHSWLCVWALVLILPHPAWMIDIGGDCGMSKAAFSKWVSLLLAFLLCVQLYVCHRIKWKRVTRISQKLITNR